MSETEAVSDSCAPRARRGPASRKKFSSSIAQTPSRVVQEKIFEAGLGNVDIRKFPARGRRYSRHLGDQGSAAVRINIQSIRITRAYLAHPAQRLQPFKQCLRDTRKSQPQQISA